MAAKHHAAESDAKVPVTVLTGFLGSGKTTLLNHILTANHGKKIAIIENEFGEVGVDDSLVKSKFNSDEEIFEMNNGCVCCTVRGDLINILAKLSKRKSKLDAIIIETTGMADPGPVAQTFFIDDDVKAFARLDGVVTLVDAKHIEQHLDEEKPEGVVNEAVGQVALADRLLLNKIDLMPEEAELQRVEARLKALNSWAPIFRCEDAGVALEHVFGIRAFELERVLDRDPAFLKAGAGQGQGGGGGGGGGELALECDEPWWKQKCTAGGCDDPNCADPEHGTGEASGGNRARAHDTKVSSVGFLTPGELDIEKANAWISTLLQDKGQDTYRMKGVLAMKDAPAKFVYQGVHMMFKGEFTEAWAEGEPRVNRLIFIGKSLDRAELKRSFESCLDPSNFVRLPAAGAAANGGGGLRFRVGDAVECRAGPNLWSRGKVVQLHHREDHFPPGCAAPYQVELEAGGALIYALQDVDEVVRKAR